MTTTEHSPANDDSDTTTNTRSMITTDQQNAPTQDHKRQASERHGPRHHDPEARRVRAAKINSPGDPATPTGGAQPC